MQTELIVTEDGSSSIYVPELDETYHSTHGAIQESKHVFIEAGLHYLLENRREVKKVNIFEIGFGTGLNALLTACSSLAHSVSINYTSIELHPLDKKITDQLNYGSQINGSAAIFEKIHDNRWGALEKVTKNFNLKKIHKSFAAYRPNEHYDLIFFDAFSVENRANF